LRQYRKTAASLRASGQTHISGKDAFELFESYGLPISLTAEMANEDGLTVDLEGFQVEYQRHKDLSRQDTHTFKGGMADHAVETTRLHTATHLLHQALRQVLGPEVHQTGSNITVERLRFDFTYGLRLSDEEIALVERLVNEEIQRVLSVEMETMPLETARRAGALAFFSENIAIQSRCIPSEIFRRRLRRNTCLPHGRAWPFPHPQTESRQSVCAQDQSRPGPGIRD